MARSFTNNKRHPYLAPGFYLDTANQFWRRPGYNPSPKALDIYRKFIESEREIYEHSVSANLVYP